MECVYICTESSKAVNTESNLLNEGNGHIKSDFEIQKLLVSLFLVKYFPDIFLLFYTQKYLPKSETFDTL